MDKKELFDQLDEVEEHDLDLANRRALARRTEALLRATYQSGYHQIKSFVHTVSRKQPLTSGGGVIGTPLIVLENNVVRERFGSGDVGARVMVEDVESGNSHLNSPGFVTEFYFVPDSGDPVLVGQEPFSRNTKLFPEEAVVFDIPADATLEQREKILEESRKRMDLMVGKQRNTFEWLNQAVRDPELNEDLAEIVAEHEVFMRKAGADAKKVNLQ